MELNPKDAAFEENLQRKMRENYPLKGAMPEQIPEGFIGSCSWVKTIFTYTEGESARICLSRI